MIRHKQSLPIRRYGLPSLSYKAMTRISDVIRYIRYGENDELYLREVIRIAIEVGWDGFGHD